MLLSDGASVERPDGVARVRRWDKDFLHLAGRGLTGAVIAVSLRFVTNEVLN
jgi:hypothetical protein